MEMINGSKCKVCLLIVTFNTCFQRVGVCGVGADECANKFAEGVLIMTRKIWTNPSLGSEYLMSELTNNKHAHNQNTQAEIKNRKYLKSVKLGTRKQAIVRLLKVQSALLYIL